MSNLRQPLQLDINSSPLYQRRIINNVDGAQKEFKRQKSVTFQVESSSYIAQAEYATQVTLSDYDNTGSVESKEYDFLSGQMAGLDVHQDGYQSSDFDDQEVFPDDEVFINNSMRAPDPGLPGIFCSYCDELFLPGVPFVHADGKKWHEECFVCVQCFRPIAKQNYFLVNDRHYCSYDFQKLFAPSCSKCQEYIVGKVLKIGSKSWHPECFLCDECGTVLAGESFTRKDSRILCKECCARETGQILCKKCRSANCRLKERLEQLIEHTERLIVYFSSQVIDGIPLLYEDNVYHYYHFNCTSCGKELTDLSKERGGKLYCLRCHDKMAKVICAACKRPVDENERSIVAIGKAWHVEHFVCYQCEKPFFGNRHYEVKGNAYCERHYNEMFGKLCFVCNKVIRGNAFAAFNKEWCEVHFACWGCDRRLGEKKKFFEMDGKPMCKKCFERFPKELKKRLEKEARNGPPPTLTSRQS